MIRTVALLLVTLPTLAHAGKALDKAQEAFDALSLEEAAPLFEKALEEPGTREERIREWRGLGLSRAFMGDNAGAKAAFEKLLLIDPDAKVDTSMGPKISRPYDAAKKAMRGKKSSLSVSRGRTGAVVAILSEAVPLAAEVQLFWRVHGQKTFTLVKGPPDQPLSVDTPPDEDLDAYAQALDAANGVLFEDGSEKAFNSLPAVVRKIAKQQTVPAVTSAADEAKRKADGKPEEVVASSDEEGGSSWPYIVGGALVVVGGGVAAYYFTRPPELQLPAADRTGQLP